MELAPTCTGGGGVVKARGCRVRDPRRLPTLAFPPEAEGRVNLVLSGLLRRLLRGDQPPGTANDPRDWTPPPPLGPLPALVDLAALPPAQQAGLATLGTMVGQQPFVPGLYRMPACQRGAAPDPRR